MMSRGKYLHHITLTTGDTRRSYRDEVSDDVVDFCGDLLSRALIAPTLIPDLDPACTLHGTSTRKGLICSIAGPDGEKIVTMAVARHSQTGAKLWRLLIETSRTPVQAIECPPEPWCAVRIEPAAVRYPPPCELLPMIADLERCLAWAWMDRQ